MVVGGSGGGGGGSSGGVDIYSLEHEAEAAVSWYTRYSISSVLLLTLLMTRSEVRV